MLKLIQAIGGGLVSLANSYFQNKAAVSKAAADAQIKSLNTEGEYDLQAQRNMRFTWKDEFIIAIHLFPVYGYLIPSDTLVTQLNLLWYKLGTVPMWWQVIYFGIVISTFGLRFMHKSILGSRR